LTDIARDDVAPAPRKHDALTRLIPLFVDLVVPLATYYVAHYVFGVGIVGALVLGSVVPVLRTVYSLIRTRSLNPLATLILAVNVAGIALSFISGDARVILVKDSGITMVIAIGLLVSAARGRSVLSSALEPWLTRGSAPRTRAWEHLEASSDRFGRLNRRYGLIWGWFLLADCVGRIVAAFTLPAAMVAGWLSTTLLVATIALAAVISGVTAAVPLTALVDAEAARGAEV
jgi:intracellular septation protein A